MPTPHSDEAARLSISVHPDVRTALKLAAVQQGVEMSDLGNELLAEALADTIRELQDRRKASQRKGQ